MRPFDPPSLSFDDAGWLTRDQMIEVDRVMINDLGINLVQMMENAGRNLADFVIRRFNPATATVLAGSGGNGGGGLVAARHMANRGVDVSVTLTKPAGDLDAVPAHQLQILTRMGVPVAAEPRRSELIVDALIGYSLRGAPRGRAAELIDGITGAATPIVSLDTPSGLDVDTGSAPGIAVNADATLTLALSKIGLRSSPNVGELYVADISVPPAVYAAMGAGPSPDFSDGTIIRVNRTG